MPASHSSHTALLPLPPHLQGKVYTINTNPAVGYWASGNKFSHLNYTEVGYNDLTSSQTSNLPSCGNEPSSCLSSTSPPSSRSHCGGLRQVMGASAAIPPYQLFFCLALPSSPPST